jgi:hypothetical protein
MSKKILLFLAMAFLLIGSAYAVQCTGDTTYTAVAGEPFIVEASGVDSGHGLLWNINSPFYPSDYVFLNDPTSNDCFAELTLIREGTHTIGVMDDYVESTFTVNVSSPLDAYGFGHQCSDVNTNNCGDIEIFGDVEASEFISATEVYAYSLLQSLGEISAGSIGSPEVRLTSLSAILPSTIVNGIVTADSLTFTGFGAVEISSPSGVVVIDSDIDLQTGVIKGSNPLTIGDNVQVDGDLTVAGTTVLHDLESISNDAPITINAGIDVAGDLTVQEGKGITFGGVRKTEWTSYQEVGIENLVPNPGFEINVDGNMLIPDSWFTPQTPPAYGTTGITTEQVYSGDYAFKLESGGTEKYYFTDFIPVSFAQDTLVTASAKYFRASGQALSVDLFISYYTDANPTYWVNVVHTHVEGTAVNAWSDLTVSQTIPPTAKFITLRLDTNAGGIAGAAYFDDVQLEIGDESTKFKPRMLDMQGNVEYNNLDVKNELYIEGFLTATQGAAIFGDLTVAGSSSVDSLNVVTDANVNGFVRANGDDSRLMGAVNLRHSCDSASPRMYQEGADFVIDLGEPASCGYTYVCVDNTDCMSNVCNANGLCEQGSNGKPCGVDIDCTSGCCSASNICTAMSVCESYVDEGGTLNN